jgi:WD40 repeat protein
MTVSHNNEQIVTGSRDRLIIVLRLETGEIEHSIEQHNDAVIAVALTQDDAILVSGLLSKKTSDNKIAVCF